MSEERTFIVVAPRIGLVEEIQAPTAGDAVYRTLDSGSGAFEEQTEGTPFGELFGSTASPTVAYVIDTANDSVSKFELTLAWEIARETVS